MKDARFANKQAQCFPGHPTDGVVSAVVYAIGWVGQFSRLEWVFADILMPIGLAGLGYAACHFLQKSLREHVTFANLPSSPNPFSQSGRRGVGLKSLSPKNGDKWERDLG